MATLGKYAFRIQNAFYLLIVVQKTVLTLYTGEKENSNIRFQASRAFVNHRIRENRLAVYLRLLAGLP